MDTRNTPYQDKFPFSHFFIPLLSPKNRAILTPPSPLFSILPEKTNETEEK